MNLKGKTKRILAGVLGILMMLGLMPATAFAATSETGVATFDYCYQSDGTNICYWASFSADGYTAGDTSGTTHRCAIYVNGDEAYCIEPGVHLLSGDTLKSNASERWNALSADRQNGVKTVLAFGKPGNSGSIGGSAGSQSAATQVLVWEMTCGIRDPKTLKRVDDRIINTQAQDVTLTYAGQEVSLTSTDAGFVNDRQKVSIDAEKVMEQSQSFGIGMNGEVTAVSFGLYAGEDIMAADGSVLPIDGLIEIAFADENGHVAFNADLPFGHYYVKELSTNPYYAKNMRVYSFDFNYAGQEIALQEVHLNNGEPIVNELLLGRIEGVKVDEGDAVLEGAVFGLFAKDTEEFTMRKL